MVHANGYNALPRIYSNVFYFVRHEGLEFYRDNLPVKPPHVVVDSLGDDPALRSLLLVFRLSDVAQQALSGEEKEAKTRESSVRRRERQLVRSGGQQSQSGSERLVRRRVLVVGDSNVARVDGGVLTTVKADRSVQMEAQSGKCMVDAMAEAQEVVGGSMDGEHVVVIHAGLNDVLKGRSQNLEELEVGMRRLRESSESVHVTICRIPEVQRQARETERRIIEANRVIRLSSRRLRYEVMEVNSEVYEARPHPFAQDGIHYDGATAKRVCSRIGRQATAFFWGPKALREPL
ncbi:uncharacterized protein LOC144101553 [Amblyomma americanum]